MWRAAPCVLLACTSHALSPATPRVPPPSGELATLAWYEGDWTCETFTYSPAKQPGAKATVHVERTLDGSWYRLAFDVAGDAENPEGVHTQEYKGYDADAKKWWMVGVGAGGSWFAYESAGWVGNQLIWIPTQQPSTTSRGVMTKVSDREYEHALEEQADGAWKPTWSKHCVKAR